MTQPGIELGIEMATYVQATRPWRSSKPPTLPTTYHRVPFGYSKHVAQYSTRASSFGPPHIKPSPNTCTPEDLAEAKLRLSSGPYIAYTIDTIRIRRKCYGKLTHMVGVSLRDDLKCWGYVFFFFQLMMHALENQT